MVTRAAIGLLLLGVVTMAQQSISIAPPNLTLDGVLASTVRHDGRDAVRLIEADDKRGGGGTIL